MEKVKKLVEAGAPIPSAIKTALGMPLTTFADKYGRSRQNINDAINARRIATDADIDALVAELGGTRDEWRMLLWEAARPTHAAV